MTEAKGLVLADDAGDAAAPNVLDAVLEGQVSVIGRMSRFVTVPAHDIGAEVGWCHGVIDPNLEMTIVFLKFLEGAGGMSAGRGQIAKGMEAVNAQAGKADARTSDRRPRIGS